MHATEGHTTVAVGSLLDDQHWHSLHIERYGHHVNLTLDGEVKRFRCHGTFEHLDLETEVGPGSGELPAPQHPWSEAEPPPLPPSSSSGG